MDYKSNRKKGCRSNDTGGINMEKLIQIKNLTKCFGETKVLDKINVNFDRGIFTESLVEMVQENLC